MPELPEVERGRGIAARAAVGRVIESVDVDASDEIVFGEAAPRDVAATLAGARVEAVHRHGKHLWFALDRRPWPMFHFGMTGSFVHYPRTHADGTAAEPPRFAKIILHLDDGFALAMPNARRLGRIRLRDDPTIGPPVADLGFDPLTGLPGPAEFVTLLTRRKAPLKAILLDQKFAAGVGNWIADEVLYQARLDPRRRGHELDDDEAKRIRTVLGRVIRKAVEVDADKRRFPRTWLFHRRWGKPSEATTTKGEPIAFDTIAGRTTAWVPTVQR